MLHEISVAGLLLPPWLPLFVIAGVLFWLSHRWISRHDGYRFFWHPALAGLAWFTVLLGVIAAVYLHWSVYD